MKIPDPSLIFPGRISGIFCARQELIVRRWDRKTGTFLSGSGKFEVQGGEK